MTKDMTLKEKLQLAEEQGSMVVMCKRKVVCTIVLRKGMEWKRFFNGPLKDDPERCTDEVGGCGCVHSEFKAILWIMTFGRAYPVKYDLAILYSPCTPCANLIVTSKTVEKVFYLYDTEHDMRGIEILLAGGVEVKHL